MNGVCCTSRLGVVKAFYASREEALDAAELVRVELEPYPCEVQPGRWHLRKIRRQTTPEERTVA